MGVNLFKIIKPPRIGAVVGGDGGTRDGGDSRHPKGTTTPKYLKTAIPFGVAVGEVVDRGMAAEAATLIPCDYSYIH